MKPDTPYPDLVEEVVAKFAAARPDISEDVLRTVCRIIVAANDLERSAAAMLKTAGLNYTDFDILGMLRAEGPPFELQPAQLIRSVMITSGAMTTALDRLQNAGFVTRRMGSDDRRTRLVSLTPKGQRVIDDALSARFARVTSALQGIAPEQLQSMNVLLRHLSICLADAPPGGPSER